MYIVDFFVFSSPFIIFLQRVLERAKFHLMQCATGEAVLRLDKTRLARDALELQRIYMKDQHHESLLDYLQHELGTGWDNSTFIQVVCLEFVWFLGLYNCLVFFVDEYYLEHLPVRLWLSIEISVPRLHITVYLYCHRQLLLLN